jgi:hypothetical protein
MTEAHFGRRRGDDPVAASRDFDEQLKSSPEHKRLTNTLKRRRIFGLILACSVALNVTFGLNANHTSSTAKDAATKAEHAINNGYVSCLANNQTRKDDLKGWHDILALFHPLDPEGQTIINKIQAIETKKDTPRNCNKLK